MLLRAKYLLHTAGKPHIENAIVEIRGQRIASVEKFRSGARKKIRDLGEVILLPGLINAHCHLNYTHLAGKIHPPNSFTDWLRQMIVLKRASTPDDFAAATREGLRQLHLSGVTTVCDIISDTGNAADFRQLSRVIRATAKNSPIRINSFVELLDLGRRATSVSVGAIFNRDRSRKSREYNSLPQRLGLSPHSPYTASSALLQAAAKSHRPLTIHIAESRDEWEMFTRKRGALFELVHNTDPTFTAFAATTPVQYLHKLGALTKHTLGVHLNYLAPTDFEIIARSRMSVVHCPRSHEYFRHQPFAAEKLLKLGVNICLGTDSAATIKAGQASSLSIDGLERDKLEACPTLFLDMFSEMRSFHRHHPKIPPREILKMATLNGARALGQQKNLGSIERGKFADLIAVPAPRHSKLIEETVIAARTPATFSMIGGERLESKLLFETASN